MVAKSFQSMSIVSDPYKENGRMYVSVKNEATGKVRKVRWYTEAEYKKLYPEEVIPAKSTFNYKGALGFKEGYITIFKGELTEDNDDWFRVNKELRYHRVWGWYLPSTEKMPEDMPTEFEPVTLKWEDVSEDGVQPKSDAKLKEAIEPLIFPPSSSEYVAEIGQRIETKLTVTSKKTKEGDYGFQNIHFFEDSAGNVLAWSTSAKSLEVGETYLIRGTVKGYTTFRNVKTTWLTRCNVADV